MNDELHNDTNSNSEEVNLARQGGAQSGISSWSRVAESASLAVADESVTTTTRTVEPGGGKHVSCTRCDSLVSCRHAREEVSRPARDVQLERDVKGFLSSISYSARINGRRADQNGRLLVEFKSSRASRGGRSRSKVELNFEPSSRKVPDEFRARIASLRCASCGFETGPAAADELTMRLQIPTGRAIADASDPATKTTIRSRRENVEVSLHLSPTSPSISSMSSSSETEPGVELKLNFCHLNPSKCIAAANCNLCASGRKGRRSRCCRTRRRHKRETSGPRRLLVRPRREEADENHDDGDKRAAFRKSAREFGLLLASGLDEAILASAICFGHDQALRRFHDDIHKYDDDDDDEVESAQRRSSGPSPASSWNSFSCSSGDVSSCLACPISRRHSCNCSAASSCSLRCCAGYCGPSTSSSASSLNSWQGRRKRTKQAGCQSSGGGVSSDSYSIEDNFQNNPGKAAICCRSDLSSSSSVCDLMSSNSKSTKRVIGEKRDARQYANLFAAVSAGGCVEVERRDNNKHQQHVTNGENKLLHGGDRLDPQTDRVELDGQQLDTQRVRVIVDQAAVTDLTSIADHADRSQRTAEVRLADEPQAACQIQTASEHSRGEPDDHREDVKLQQRRPSKPPNIDSHLLLNPTEFVLGVGVPAGAHDLRAHSFTAASLSEGSNLLVVQLAAAARSRSLCTENKNELQSRLNRMRQKRERAAQVVADFWQAKQAATRRLGTLTRRVSRLTRSAIDRITRMSASNPNLIEDPTATPARVAARRKRFTSQRVKSTDRRRQTASGTTAADDHCEPSGRLGAALSLKIVDRDEQLLFAPGGVYVGGAGPNWLGAAVSESASWMAVRGNAGSGAISRPSSSPQMLAATAPLARSSIQNGKRAVSQERGGDSSPPGASTRRLLALNESDHAARVRQATTSSQQDCDRLNFNPVSPNHEEDPQVNKAASRKQLDFMSSGCNCATPVSSAPQAMNKGTSNGSFPTSSGKARSWLSNLTHRVGVGSNTSGNEQIATAARIHHAKGKQKSTKSPSSGLGVEITAQDHETIPKERLAFKSRSSSPPFLMRESRSNSLCGDGLLRLKTDQPIDFSRSSTELNRVTEMAERANLHLAELSERYSISHHEFLHSQTMDRSAPLVDPEEQKQSSSVSVWFRRGQSKQDVNLNASQSARGLAVQMLSSPPSSAQLSHHTLQSSWPSEQSPSKEAAINQETNEQQPKQLQQQQHQQQSRAELYGANLQSACVHCQLIAELTAHPNSVYLSQLLAVAPRSSSSNSMTTDMTSLKNNQSAQTAPQPSTAGEAVVARKCGVTGAELGWAEDNDEEAEGGERVEEAGKDEVEDGNGGSEDQAADDEDEGQEGNLSDRNRSKMRLQQEAARQLEAGQSAKGTRRRQSSMTIVVVDECGGQQVHLEANTSNYEHLGAISSAPTSCDRIEIQGRRQLELGLSSTDGTSPFLILTNEPPKSLSSSTMSLIPRRRHQRRSNRHHHHRRKREKSRQEGEKARDSTPCSHRRHHRRPSQANSEATDVKNYDAATSATKSTPVAANQPNERPLVSSDSFASLSSVSSASSSSSASSVATSASTGSSTTTKTTSSVAQSTSKANSSSVSFSLSRRVSSTSSYSSSASSAVSEGGHEEGEERHQKACRRHNEETSRPSPMPTIIKSSLEVPLSKQTRSNSLDARHLLGSAGLNSHGGHSGRGQRGQRSSGLLQSDERAGHQLVDSDDDIDYQEEGDDEDNDEDFGDSSGNELEERDDDEDDEEEDYPDGALLKPGSAKSNRSRSVDISLPTRPGEAYGVMQPHQLDAEIVHTATPSSSSHQQVGDQVGISGIVGVASSMAASIKATPSGVKRPLFLVDSAAAATASASTSSTIQVAPTTNESASSSRRPSSTSDAWAKKFIQDEIRVPYANGETRALKLFVDWNENCANGEHLWVYMGSSSEACYVGESECLKHGPRLSCSACKITAHTGCIEILTEKIKFICKPTFKDLIVGSPQHLKELQQQNVIYHHWVHKRTHCGRCKQCTKTIGNTKLTFSSKEIQAITCSWCKVSYHNKENCYTLSTLTEPCTLGVHRESILPPSWILKLPVSITESLPNATNDKLPKAEVTSDIHHHNFNPQGNQRCNLGNSQMINDDMIYCQTFSTVNDNSTPPFAIPDSSNDKENMDSSVMRQRPDDLAKIGQHKSGSNSTLMTETSGYVTFDSSNVHSLTSNIASSNNVINSPTRTFNRKGFDSPKDIVMDSSALNAADLSIINQSQGQQIQDCQQLVQQQQQQYQSFSNSTNNPLGSHPTNNLLNRRLNGQSGTYLNDRRNTYQNFKIVPRPIPGVPNAGSKPVLVFVNPRSGGNQGAKMMQKFNWLLNPRQVFDLIHSGGPGAALELYRDVPNLCILTIGGDGTASWILSHLDDIGMANKIPVAVLPLGTGNDLARALGWGGGYADEPIAKVIAQVRDSEIVQLDRWNLHVEQNNEVAPSSPNEFSSTSSGANLEFSSSPSISSSPSFYGAINTTAATSTMSILDQTAANCDINATNAVQLDETGSDRLPMDVINNYFSFGVDAHIALEFHTAREAHPERFNSRLRNKMFYGQAGGKDLLKRKWKDLSNFVTLYCDGQDMTGRLKELKVHSVLFLNIPSYGGGTRPWPTTATAFRKPRTDDGLIEVIGLTTYQLPLLQAGGHGTSIAQCRNAKIITSRTIPMQVDGEPCKLLPSIITISLKNRVCMLAKSKASCGNQAKINS